MKTNHHINNIENKLLSLSYQEKIVYLKILNDTAVKAQIVNELTNSNYLILNIINIKTLDILDLVKLYYKFTYGQIVDNCSDSLQKEIYLSVITEGMKHDDIFSIPYYFKYLDFTKFSLTEIRTFCREFFWNRDFIIERLNTNNNFYLKYINIDNMTDNELEEFLLYTDNIVVDNWVKEIHVWSKKFNLNLPNNKKELLAIDKIIANDKKITYIPKEIGQLQNLQEIEFSNVNLSIFDDNIIDCIPKEFYNLLNLKKINISNNKIKTILPNISNLKDLEELHVNNNLLEEIPKEIANLRNLKQLYISNNKLNTKSKNFFSKSTINLPKEFVNLRNLIILDDNSKPKTNDEDIVDYFHRNNYILI